MIRPTKSNLCGSTLLFSEDCTLEPSSLLFSSFSMVSSFSSFSVVISQTFIGVENWQPEGATAPSFRHTLPKFLKLQIISLSLVSVSISLLKFSLEKSGNGPSKLLFCNHLEKNLKKLKIKRMLFFTIFPTDQVREV